MQHQHTQTPSDRPRFWRSRYGVAFLIIAAVAAYFLLKEHTAHVAGYLPFPVSYTHLTLPTTPYV